MSSLSKSPTPIPGASGQAYWRSLDHLADTPEFREFMHREFPAGASELLDSGDRRHFLKIMGTSMALAGFGLAGCRRWPVEEIAPFAARPDDHVPGAPDHYATSMTFAGVAQGLVATSFDGRPTKIEGNPDHPGSAGAADVFAQASILDLYDPDRSRGVQHAGAASSWEDFEGWAASHFAPFRANNGRGLAILSEASQSPTLRMLRERMLRAMPEALWFEYESINNDNEVDGSTRAFRGSYRAQYDFAKARTIVSLDADFLGTHPNAVANIRSFAQGRKPSREMSRLYAFESDLTLTGSNADHRVPMRSQDIPLVAAYLAGRIAGQNAVVSSVTEGEAASVLSSEVRAVLDQLVADLTAHPGAGVIVAGRRQSADVHYLVNYMNSALGAAGKIVTYTATRGQAKHAESIGRLAQTIGTGAVKTLVMLGGNPVYDAPADLDFAEVMGDLEGAVVHLSAMNDETSVAVGEQGGWHVNRAHYLESWGDGRAWDGTFCMQQPLIEPLFDGKSDIEIVATVLGGPSMSGRELVQRNFEDMVGASDDRMWRRVLHAGLLTGSAATRETPSVDNGGVLPAVQSIRTRWAQRGDWEVVFAPSPSLWDGRYANNGWLQELPDPVTKLTWDNAALVSPRSAEELGVESGDMLEVASNGTPLSIPVLVQPGVADRAVIVALGGGRDLSGARICNGAGVNVAPLRTTAAMNVASGSAAKGRGRYPLATTQDHHTIDVESVAGKSVQDRLPSLFREANLGEYVDDPGFAEHRTHVVHRLSLWEEGNLEGAQYAWGMSVDLNGCVGCGACVVACQAENNIPVVGKDQVRRGRELHWMRIDRYFKFAKDENGGWDANKMDGVALQPVLCMHCENAPCEQVCPVAATVHDEDGLNVMVYNRCIGTRYCSNNCPYKVRRFNYFDYHRREPVREQDGLLQVQPDYYVERSATADPVAQMQFNPEVTVRMRGVMEKCTYCVQRIADAKIKAKNAWVGQSTAAKENAGERIEIADGAVTPACAQTCPAQAIVFGDLNDPNSRVARLHENPRSYEMLEELNVKARTQYLAKVRNPAAALVPASEDGGHGGGHGDDAGHTEEGHG